MSARSKPAIPATPRIISPSPTPETHDGADESYFAPVTRSAARKRQNGGISTQVSVHEPIDEESDPDLRRSRTLARSPTKTRKISSVASTTGTQPNGNVPKGEALQVEQHNGFATANGHLAPPKQGWSWRDLSRSPSPLGLIPIHRNFRTLIHKHEVPRKVLHSSIGFIVYWLYATGTQPTAVTFWLMAALIPIATTDFLRHRYKSLNSFYVSCLGAFMRESEYAGWNGVIFYLLGAWIVLFFLPKDVAVVSVMLLSWCDTAASTFGRMWGRYTPRIRHGKSLAGSLAACVFGVVTAAWFWGWVAPRTPTFPGDDQHPFMFKGTLGLPEAVSNALGLSQAQATIDGTAALVILSLWSGLAAAGSEVVDVFGLDDNLTIPVLSGLAIWAFLKVFG